MIQGDALVNKMKRPDVKKIETTDPHNWAMNWFLGLALKR
jgi:hypothetical protein